VWTFWPMSAEGLYQRGEALMRSENPEDWEKAWRDYLDPLNQQYPDNPYKNEVNGFLQRVEVYRTERDVKRKARFVDALSLYDMITKASELRKNGDPTRAEAILKGLRSYYDDPQVVVLSAKTKIDALRNSDQVAEAEGLQKAMMDLYKDNPEALKLLKKE